MLEYKGYTIEEGQGMYGVKIYKAMRNPHHSIASNQSLAWIVERIDREVEKEGGK